VSVFSDMLSFNRMMNATKSHFRTSRISPQLGSIVSARCLGKECSLEQLLMIDRVHPGLKKKQLYRKFYIKRMRSS
jgi:hypothetical protein